ncbi:hypothetical protein AVEN_241915-1 [Araneus ventricosus]|uniref:Integrase zinc-binding domain-containing protein n=1 Tax=Araneus ventricosus TaxID=182803 RepID=A0A4Y2S9C9_ARAVE|nr:hypothetical protein AVEN_133372-1 [Araneus ventricosus]GBN84832.1 hypothetical protein AVEN_241915-1 [Araneus ventricosus]
MDPVRRRYIWKSLRKDCAIWCKTCISCQKSKIDRHTKSPIGKYPLPSGPKSYQEFLTTLHEHFREIQPKQTSDHSGRLFFVHKDLSDASHAFVRQDMVKRTLRQPYNGPFKVLARKPT